MKIAIPQINYKAGDIDGNSEKILRAIRQAEKEKAKKSSGQSGKPKKKKRN